jgi:GAF domain-containing protein
MSNDERGIRDGPTVTAPDEHQVPGNDLATMLSDVAQSLQQEPDLQETLQGIVDAAAEAIPGAQHVSVSSVIKRREVHTRASTNDLPKAVDQAQYETGQGPCLDTLYEQRTARIPNVAVEERWPVFAAQASELGVASMLSVQLFVQGEDLGALNIFSKEVEAFDEESEHVALLFASHAAVAMVGAQEKEQLKSAIEFRDLIGQAKGILVERFQISGDQAFQVLARASQNSNRKLRDVAAERIQQRTRPPLPR